MSLYTRIMLCNHQVSPPGCAACLNGGFFGAGKDADGGQAEAIRVPLADGTLVKVPRSGHSEATMRALLTLSDVK